MHDGGTLTISSRAVRQPRASEKPTHLAVEFKDTGQGMTDDQRAALNKSAPLSGS